MALLSRLVVARILEDAHQEGHSSVRISLKHDDYNVDLQTMQQASATQPSKSRSVRREDTEVSSQASTSGRSSFTLSNLTRSLSEASLDWAQRPCCTVASGDEKLSVQRQFSDKWDKNTGPLPNIGQIYKIHVIASVEERFRRCCEEIGDVPVFGHGESPGNQQRRFHGTRQTCNFNGHPCDSGDCPACSILHTGFSVDFIGSTSGNRGYYGAGIYLTSWSSTARGYGGSENVIIVTQVAAGMVEVVRQRTTAAIPEGCHSRVANKSSGKDELMVPLPAQCLPLFLIIF
ncbi:unnamed protein product [Effrenium voratum]|uniref:WWE domain-containing protein n=1 Tax=Effrenium voratum TaxID=2562239 RepID=A0AA36J6K4_9DINO|nr:unnamed protein product [Effrenium voratum]